MFFSPCPQNFKIFHNFACSCSYIWPSLCCHWPPYDVILSFYFHSIVSNFFRCLAFFFLQILNNWVCINIFYYNKQVAFVTYASQYLCSHKLTCDTLHLKTGSTFFFYFVYCHCHRWESSYHMSILKSLLFDIHLIE